MMENRNNRFEIVKQLRKVMVLLSVISMPLLVSGCATALMASAGAGRSTTTIVTSDKVVGHDVIYAVGESNSPEILEKFPNALYMVGEKNTYAITEGGYLLRKIVSTFDPASIVLVGKAIKLEVSDREFYGEVTLNYKKTWESMSKQERDIMTEFHFVPCTSWFSKYYSKTFTFRGVISPKAANFDSIKSQFSRPRPVELHAVKRKDIPEIGAYLHLLFALPLTITFDVVTAPIQILFFAAAASAHSAKPTELAKPTESAKSIKSAE